MISEIPIMLGYESISTSTAVTSKKALKPLISKKYSGWKIKKLYNKIINKLSSPNNNKQSCIQNTKEDNDSDDSDYKQMSTPGVLKLTSTNLSKGLYKKISLMKNFLSFMTLWNNLVPQIHQQKQDSE